MTTTMHARFTSPDNTLMLHVEAETPEELRNKLAQLGVALAPPIVQKQSGQSGQQSE